MKTHRTGTTKSYVSMCLIFEKVLKQRVSTLVVEIFYRNKRKFNLFMES